MGLMNPESFFGADTVQGYNAAMDGGKIDEVTLGNLLGAIAGSANKNFIQPPLEALQYLTSPESRQFSATGVPANSDKFVQSAMDMGLGMTGLQMGKNVAQKGVGGLMNDPNTLSIFGGQNAKNADLDALAMAKKMIDEGVSKEQVWKDTGWGKAQDGKWRFEIDDSGFSLNTTPKYSDEHGFKVMDGNVIQHPELKGNYPMDAETTTISFDPSLKGQGSYKHLPALDDLPAEDLIRVKDPANAPAKEADIKGMIEYYQTVTGDDYKKALIDDGMSDVEVNEYIAEGKQYALDKMKELRESPDNEIRYYRDTPETLLHELQHTIQQKEGFAKGGSAQGVWRDKDTLRFAQEELKDLASPESSRFLNTSSAEEAYNTAGHNIYNRLLGETEARAVQDRMNLTPQQRREQFPEYLGRDDLIVRGLMGDN